jgi:hypothetical protein
MKHFHSPTPVVLLQTNPGATLPDCTEEAKQFAVNSRTAVAFVYAGRMYLWHYDETLGTAVSQMVH